MFDRFILQTRLGPLLLIWVSLAAGGCTEELGPERLPVARVSGVVREGSRPVGGGWIEFIPVDETVGNLCSAKLGVDGSFNAKSVAVGVNLIRLVNAPLKTPGASQLVGAYQSPIRRKIVAEPTEPLSIDVVDELIRHQSSRLRPATLPSQKTGGGR
jgi:hypothetical protein